MTRVDLYLIKGSTFSDQIDFCCRLTEKAFPLHPKIHIHTAESIQNEALNEALWSFKAESFLPHVISDVSVNSDPPDQKIAPITIGTQTISLDDDKVHENKDSLLISIGQNLPENYRKFKRLCLIVLNIDADIQHARELYKQIKEQGLEVHTQDLRK